MLFSVPAIFSERCPAQEISEYEPIMISLNISQIGVVDVPVFIRNQALYLPVNGLFTFLKIQNSPSPGYDSVTGFFIEKQATYVIDRALNRIEYQGKIFDLHQGDLIRTETNLYLRSDYFGQVFGLKCDFDFSSLSAVLTSNIELPIIREMRMELMRSNLNRLKEGVIADTVIDRKYPLFHFGNADWSLISTQQIPGKNDLGLIVAMGSIIAGGEANVTLNYTTNRPFTEKQQTYLWHYANNESPYLRQVFVGKVSGQAISSIFAPIVGVQFTNTPTTYRRTFGTYTLSDYTEPGWVVELYVNNVLVDYRKADASGFFTFEVPLVYGNTAVMLRFYGPWGEEHTRQQNISIPFNFLPYRKLEYTVTAAMVEDFRNSIFSRANVNYGLTNRMTVGIGTEYLSSILGRKLMPFTNFSLRVGSSLLVSGEYSYGVRGKGVVSCILPLDLHVELNYTRYHLGQQAVVSSFYEDRRAVFSLPVRSRHFASFMRLTFDQMYLMHSKNFTTELLFSGTVYGISTNITTYALFNYPANPYVYSTFSLSFRIPGRIIMVPQTQFEYNSSRFVSIKIDAEKQIFTHGVVKLTLEQNFAAGIRNVQVGLRYDFPYAQTGASAIFGNKNSSFIQTARGSLMFDGKTNWVGANNLTSVGKGGIVILPFLDLNDNGKHDKGEPKVTGLTLHMTGGRVVQNKRDSTVRILDLEPFTSYFIEIDRSSFDNVAWQIRKPVISVAVDPNMFKLVEVPVSVLGEATGMAYIQTNQGLLGQGRIIVSFFRPDSTLAGRTLSEADGYFSFLGLAPGAYFAKIDAGQLKKLDMAASPGILPFKINCTRDGDQAVGLDFVLSPNHPDTTSAEELAKGIHGIPPPSKGQPGPDVKKDTVAIALEEKPAVTLQPVAGIAGIFPGTAASSRRREEIVPIPRLPGMISIPGKPMAVSVQPPPSFTGIQSLPAAASKVPAPVVAIAPEFHGADSTRQQPLIAETRQPAVTPLKTALPGSQPHPHIEVTSHRQDVAGNIGSKAIRANNATLTNAEREEPGKHAGNREPVAAAVKDSCGVAIQVGAFYREKNALRTHARLAGSLDHEVSIVVEEGYSKVRVRGFANMDEARKMLPELKRLGYPETLFTSNSCIYIQAGAYRIRSNALKAQQLLTLKQKHTTLIVLEDGLYKVRVTGFGNPAEAERALPAIAGQGFTDAFIQPVM